MGDPLNQQGIQADKISGQRRQQGVLGDRETGVALFMATAQIVLADHPFAGRT